MIKTIRTKLDEFRASIFALTLLQAFMMSGVVEAVEVRQQGKLLAEAESARLARTFGVPAEHWQIDTPSGFERAKGVVAEEVSEILDHSRNEVSRLIDEMTAVDPENVTTASSIVTSLTQDEGLAGSADDAARAHTKPRYIPKRPALDAGEGERTVVRRPLAAKVQTSLKAQTSDVFPLHRVVRKARTVDAGSVAPAQRISSAFAPASPPAQKQAKAIAPEIVALAASLDNSPSKIFRYVHDQITYDPKWGADTPPLGTVWEGSGTSWDQAWLLQELLQAAGVDARLEWGEVEIPTSLLMNLTGIDDPVRAGDFLTTAGLQVVLLTVGSQIVSARFPHVWVKAHLDYIPNRGARLGTPDTWIRMDPSLTAHERTDGLRLDQDVPFVLDDHLLSGTELSPRDDYEAALNDHIATQGLPLANLDEAKSLNAQVAEEFPFVPGTLRAKILTTAGESETLPVDYEQDVQIQVREEGGGALLTFETTAAAIYGQRLELVWGGATSSDQATLDLYGGIYATPPYEVSLRPSLRLDGVEVVQGNGDIGSAEDAEIQMTLTPPGATPAEDGIQTIAGWDLFAGEHGVFSLDYGRAPPQLADRFAQNADAAAGDAQEVEGWKLAQAAASYLHTLGGDLPHLVDLNWHRLITFNTAVFAVQRGAASTSPNGTPQTFSPGPLSLDVGAMPLAVMPVDGVQVSTVPTMTLVGSQGSFREGEALTSVFGGEHLTGVTFLTRAVREGQTITKVDATNLDAALADADINSDAKGAVRYAVELLGSEAWIPEEQIESNTFQTTGYILLNPTTGAGGYFVTFERRFTPLDGAVTFHNPIDLDVITAPTDVIATIDAEGIENWTLSTRPTGGSASTVIATGTGPVDNTVLGQFDPTLLLNGMHDLVLTGNDAAGQPVTGKITVVVEGQMKLGHFTLSFIDLALPFSGLDIEVVRTYDSRQRQEQLDFGQGWQLDIRQGSYRNNRLPGDGWQIVPTSGPFGLPCQQVRETKSHLSTIRLSDREVYEFRLRLVDPAISLGGCFARAAFEFVDGPLPGSKLEILGNDEVFYGNASDHMIDIDTLEVFVPENVRLTTRDGRIFHLNLETGVTHLEDTHGNALEITASGITHSSGQGIDFERDSEGRIVSMTDPKDQSNHYTYDAEGNLEIFTNRADGVTRFTYLPGHYLEEIENDLGIRAVRTEYDEDGRMVRMIDSSGKVAEFAHDLDARREILTNRVGGTRILEYDDHGNVVRETDEKGKVTSRTFDNRGNLLMETDPLQRTLSYSYTAANDVSKVVDPAGNVRKFTYDGFGQTEIYEDPEGNLFTNSYDDNGNLLSSVDALGQVTTFSYDAIGNLRFMEDPEGRRFEYFYDGSGRRTRVVDARGHETLFEYDSNSNLIEQRATRTTPTGLRTLVTEWTYDEIDRVVSVTGPDGASTSRLFDGIGQIERVTDAMGNETAFDYDGSGRLERIDYAEGSHERRIYDDEGRLIGRVDRSGNGTSFAWDPAGNLQHAVYADSSKVEYLYDDSGQLIAEIDELGHSIRYVRDGLGQITEIIDALDGRFFFGYDANENLVSTTDAKGNTTTFEYDPLGNMVGVEHPDGGRETITYDSRGRRVGHTDPDGLTTEFFYDPANALQAVRDALGAETTYQYDELGNRVSMTDANSHTTRFEFDDAGRPIRRILPDESAESWTYRADGKLATRTSFNSAVTTYSYDTAGLLTSRNYPDGTSVGFAYDAVGQRLSATDARGTTQYAYDARGRLLQLTYPDGRQLEYTYDAAGQRTERRALVGGQVLATGYSYDALGRLASVLDSTGETYSFAYDDNDNLTQTTYPNGVVTSRTFDPRDREIASSTVQSATGDILSSAAISFSLGGRRQQRQEQDGTVRSYDYDAVGRLAQERVVDSAAALVSQLDLTYDAVGNRLTRRFEEAPGSIESTTYLYDTRDRLALAGDVALSWDDGGRLVGRTGDDAASYEWDFEDRLRKVVVADGTEVLYTYDADGNRVRVEITPPNGPPSAINYLVDTSLPLSQVVAETDGNGDLTAHYTLANEALAINSSAQGKRFYHADALGSVRLLSDISGQVSDTYTYGAFGQIVDHQGTSNNPIGFTGQPFDATIGLSYHRARWMDPELGLFVSMDPFPGFAGSPTSLNKYAYANGDPINVTDPTGLFGFAEISIANGIRGIVSQIQIDIGLDILMAVDPSGDIAKFALLMLLATGGFALAKGIIWAVKGGFKTLISKAKTVFFDRAAKAFRDSRTGRFAARHQILKAEKAAFESLAEYRKGRGLPATGSADDAATTARLDIDGQTFFGHNAHGKKVDIKVNPQTRTHAEAHVFQQAKDAGTQAPQATLYVDRDLCKACGANGGVGSLLRGTGVDELVIVSPSGRFRITASRPSTPVPIDLP